MRRNHCLVIYKNQVNFIKIKLGIICSILPFNDIVINFAALKKQ